MKKMHFIGLGVLMLLLNGCTPELPSLREGIQAGRVELTAGPWHDAMERESQYLLSLNSDRLLHHFRKVAGIESDTKEYGGWEMEWRELRGHSIGHYLSACSRMYSLSGDSILRDRCNYTVRELRKCQEKMGTGYLSAFPDEYLDRVEICEKVWAPYYTLHKILAGLLDCYSYCSDDLALETALDLTHYLYGRIIPLGWDQFQEVLDNTEQGGMNEVFWDLFEASGDTICRELAQTFYQESYFDPLLRRVDSLKGQHSNSFIPNVVGIAREYEFTGDITRRQMAEFFWEQVVQKRSYVTGGTSNGECWNTEPGHLHTELGAAAHESCCTYNMIKLSRHLWQWSQDTRYQDYMERALVNGILPTQNRETGMSMYYVSMAPGYYKTWGTPDSSFWCCTGTGMENFSRISEYIYQVEAGRLYVNQFVSSTLDYMDEGFKIIQRTSLPGGDRVELRIECARPTRLNMGVRIPGWTGDQYELKLNGEFLTAEPASDSYLMLDRVWKDGDHLEITFSPGLWYSLLPETNENVAFGFGPVVLAAKFEDAEVESALRQRYGPYDGAPVEVPAVPFTQAGFPAGIEEVDPLKRHFRMETIGGGEIDLVPFYDIHREHYSVYFPIGIH